MSPGTRKLDDAHSKWRSSIGEHLILIVGVALATAAIITGYIYSKKNRFSAGSDLVVQRLQHRPLAQVKRQQAPLLKKLLLVVVDNGKKAQPYIHALSESVSSYYGTHVTVTGLSQYDKKLLKKSDGAIFFGNAQPGEKQLPVLKNLYWQIKNSKKKLIWIGHGFTGFAGESGFEVSEQKENKIDVSKAWLFYRKAELPAGNLKLAGQVGVGGSGAKVVARLKLENDRFVPLALQSDRILYVAWDPFSDAASGFLLTITIDAMSGLLGNRKKDRRVVFRLEDVNSVFYGNKDKSFRKTTDFLLGKGVFIHLGIIPLMVDKNGKKVALINQSRVIMNFIRSNPDKTVVIQHGTRHHRTDPRNYGKMSGDAYEFFLTDDHTLGRDVASAFALQRIGEGYRLMKQAGLNVEMFEAPHYEMSPSQQQAANRYFSVMHHSPLFYRGKHMSFFLPWFTQRKNVVYTPSSAGYVDSTNKNSVKDILYKLEMLGKIMPDPVVVVFFHPFMIDYKGREGDLAALIQGMKKLDYRFVNTLDQVVIDSEYKSQN